MARLGLSLREAVHKHGRQNAYLALRENVSTGKVDLKRDLSLKEMATSFLGDNWEPRLRAWSQGGMAVRESAEAVDASHFAAITGQLLVDTVREKYTLATQIGNEIFTTMPITNGNLTTQREPWLSRVKDSLSNVQQGMPYPTTSFDPQYVDYPAPEKFGEICNVTFEMIFSDLTSQALESAESVGEMTGLEEEYRKLKVFLGLVNNFSWNGTTYNTYLASGAWVNKQTGFTLTDWRSVNSVEQLFAQITDPVTGKPIEIDAKDLFVMPIARYSAKRILNATEVREGDINTTPGTQTISGNPLDTNYRVLTSKHARKVSIDSGTYTAAQTDTITVWGDFKKAFAWRQVYPMKTTQAPPQNPWEFAQDIVMSVKTSNYGVACVRDPRFAQLAYNSAAS